MLTNESPSSKGMYLSMFLSVLYFHMYLTDWLRDCGYGAGLSDQKWNDCIFMITAFAHIDPQTNELKQMQLVRLRKLVPEYSKNWLKLPFKPSNTFPRDQRASLNETCNSSSNETAVNTATGVTKATHCS